jgi:hypothetical protein
VHHVSRGSIYSDALHAVLFFEYLCTWNDWNLQYADAKWPRLMVRFEDLVFFPKQVTRTVCECAGGELNKEPFHYVTESAKHGTSAHGKLSVRTTYVDALVKYGTERGRYDGYEPGDLRYAARHLDRELMRLFHYKSPTAHGVKQKTNSLEKTEALVKELRPVS